MMGHYWANSIVLIDGRIPGKIGVAIAPPKNGSPWVHVVSSTITRYACSASQEMVLIPTCTDEKFLLN